MHIETQPRGFVTVVARMIDHYYKLPGNVMGGLLHIVLDDYNTSVRDILWCVGEAENPDPMTEFLAYSLLELTVEERYFVVREWDTIANGKEDTGWRE